MAFQEFDNYVPTARRLLDGESYAVACTISTFLTHFGRDCLLPLLIELSGHELEFVGIGGIIQKNLCNTCTTILSALDVP